MTGSGLHMICFPSSQMPHMMLCIQNVPSSRTRTYLTGPSFDNGNKSLHARNACASSGTRNARWISRTPIHNSLWVLAALEHMCLGLLIFSPPNGNVLLP